MPGHVSGENCFRMCLFMCENFVKSGHYDLKCVKQLSHCHDHSKTVIQVTLPANQTLKSNCLTECHFFIATTKQ
jgi:hypothetical protein